MSPARLSRLQVGKLFLLSLPLAGLGCGGNGGTDVVLPSLSIRTSTTGTELDPDGYSVRVDGLAQQPIGLQATVTVERLADGLHSVELLGVASNCSAGENPRSVTVTAGATATVAFTIACNAATGAIRVVTTTGGPGTDPDGFTVLLDGNARGPIGLSDNATLDGVAAGDHAVGLSGLAANCQVSGDNPRGVTVTAGQTVEVAFAVTCAQPPPATGNLQITVTTTGANVDADGYQVTMDGGAGQPIAANGTITLANVSAVEHVVQLIGLASNCAVSGDNPIGTAVPAGGTATISFAVSCVATAGELAVTISGLPGAAQAAVTVTGPDNFSQLLTATRILTGLDPGTYTVSAANVVTGGTTYTPSVSRPSVDVVAGGTAAVTVSYTAVAPITLNLRIDGLYLTQSTQTYTSTVPLVAGRDGFLRVFVLGNESNTARPVVRVRLIRPGATTRTFNIPAPGGATPTQVQEGTLSSSWNLQVPGSLIQPGLGIVAEVDQADVIDESNETDNRFPATGTKGLTVETVPAARIRFVSVQQGSSAPGDISNPDQLIRLAGRLHPLNAIDTDLDGAVFTASAALEASGAGWSQVLGDLDAKRVAEGTDRTYYGVAKLGYGRLDGLVGLAFQGVPTALGWDDASDAGRVVAHELGHTWSQLHTPCGNPPSIDSRYPYGNGIGVFGFDVAAGSLKPPSTPDIMGYCTSPWISDFTYASVMAFREDLPDVVRAGAAQPSMLVWGRIENGRPVLEPAYQIVTRPSLPRRPGPYSVTATAADGARLFTLSFDAAAAADDPRGSRHFAFAVPLDPTRAARAAGIRLAAPGGTAELESGPTADLQLETIRESIIARREGQSVALQWNAAVHPTIMVRDPETGKVLSFARGGNARVWTTNGELDLEVSDGVRSQRLRLAINR